MASLSGAALATSGALGAIADIAQGPKSMLSACAAISKSRRG
jgi:hypothetical protein